MIEWNSCKTQNTGSDFKVKICFMSDINWIIAIVSTVLCVKMILQQTNYLWQAWRWLIDFYLDWSVGIVSKYDTISFSQRVHLFMELLIIKWKCKSTSSIFIKLWVYKYKTQRKNIHIFYRWIKVPSLIVINIHLLCATMKYTSYIGCLPKVGFDLNLDLSGYWFRSFLDHR